MRAVLVMVGTLAAAGWVSGQPEGLRLMRSRINTTLGGWHSTTRGTVRLVHVHRGRWLVFRGDPNAYHFSEDGFHWTCNEAQEASRSHLVDGDTIYTHYSVDVDPAPDRWDMKHYAAIGKIGQETIAWGEGKELPLRLSYYPDIQRTTDGYFTMTGRAVMTSDAGEMTGEEMLYARTTRPNDFLSWGEEVRCFEHTGDPVGERWKEVGSVAHENIVLDNGKSYLLAMMTVDGKGLLLGRLHDGKQFVGDDVVLGENMSTWRGTDKRMCAAFDPGTRTIHCSYVDHDGGLWYRKCVAPYGLDDWSAPERIGPENAFTTVLSLNRTRDPAQVWVLYGQTAYENPNDRRQAWGDLYLIRHEGESWSDPVLVSQPDEHENWYPNMNGDVGYGFGILYLKGGQEGPEQDGKRILDIMFASTGKPREE